MRRVTVFLFSLPFWRKALHPLWINFLALLAVSSVHLGVCADLGAQVTDDLMFPEQAVKRCEAELNPMLDRWGAWKVATMDYDDASRSHGEWLRYAEQVRTAAAHYTELRKRRDAIDREYLNAFSRCSYSAPTSEECKERDQLKNSLDDLNNQVQASGDYVSMLFSGKSVKSLKDVDNLTRKAEEEVQQKLKKARSLSPDFSGEQLDAKRNECDTLRAYANEQARRSGQGAGQTQKSVSIRGSSTARVGGKVTLTVSPSADQGTLRYHWEVSRAGGASSKGTTLYKDTLVIDATQQGQFTARVTVSRKLQDGTWSDIGSASHPLTVSAASGTAGQAVKQAVRNYQKIPGLTVTINGVTKSCPAQSGDTSQSSPPGVGDCVFEVSPGTCTVSVQASGYRTETFEKRCDKDETFMTTLTKTR